MDLYFGEYSPAKISEQILHYLHSKKILLSSQYQDWLSKEGKDYFKSASRLADGHVFFAVMSQGQLVVGKDFYAYGIDPKFDATNGSTNRLTVVGQGMDFTIYSNGAKLGEANPYDPLPTLDLPEPPPRPDNMLDPTVPAAYQRELASHRAVVNRLKNEYDERLRLWRTVEKDFERGFVAMGVAAQSGRTQCEFNNSWLWLMNEP